MRSPSNNRPARHAIVCGLAFLLGARGAVAANAVTVTVDHDVVGCPAVTELEARVAASLDAHDDADTHAAVRIRRADGGALVAEASLSRRGAVTARTIEGSEGECVELVAAAALTLGLAAGGKPAAPAPAPAPPAPPEAHEPARPDAPTSAPVVLGRERFGAIASGVASVGLLPRPQAGAHGDVRVRVGGPLLLSVRGLWLPEATPPNEAFALGLGAGGAGVCVDGPIGSDGALALVGCAHAMVGVLSARPVNQALASTDAAVWGAASASGGIRAKVGGPLVVAGDITAYLPVTRPTFLADTCPKTGFEQPFAALGIFLGAGLSIP